MRKDILDSSSFGKVHEIINLGDNSTKLVGKVVIIF
jgi:hypothetical protein